MLMTSPVIIGTISWGVIGWITLGTIIFLIVVAAVGRGIAAAFPPKPEHTSSFKKPKLVSAQTAAGVPNAVPVARHVPTDISPEIIAVISAAVAVTLRGQKFRVRGVRPADASVPNIERLMAEWSMEGRRQVYSSHQLR